MVDGRFIGQRLSRHLGHHLSVLQDAEHPIIGDAADLHRCQLPLLENGLHLGHPFRADDAEHSLLRLREEDLPGGEALVLQGHAVELNTHAGVLAHLAGSAGDPSGAQIRDGAQAAGVAQVGDRLHEVPLDDRVADLDGGGLFLGRLPGHLCGAGCRAVQAVASGSPAQ